MSSLDTCSRPNLIIGCGYLGRRVAARWLRAGRRVAALTRGNSSSLASIGIEPIVGDVLHPESLQRLPPAATVLYAVGMDRSAGASMHDVYVGGLKNVLDALPDCARFIYVSSTGVYGQSDGDWVNEDSPTEPTEESGRVVLEAERLIKSRLTSFTILRFAGLYGPDRLLRKAAILKGEPLVGDSEKWLNLIHVDDGADAVLALEAHISSGETYNIVDNEPTHRRDFYELLAKLLNAPPAAFDHRPEPGSANRRVGNRKVTNAVNWRPRLFNYQQGLPAAVAASTL